MRLVLARSTIAVSVAASVAAIALAAAVTPAAADRETGGSGSTEGGNVQAQATIVVNGDVKGGGGGSVKASAPALCWWEKAPIETGATIEVLSAFLAAFGIPFDTAALQQIKDAEKDGKTFEWYTRKTREGATKEQLEAAGCNDFSGPFKGLFIGSIFRPFEPGNPPEPLPDPKEMADVALENIDLAAPALTWNPKVDSLGGGTLVNLPTWFWVPTRVPPSAAATVSAA